MSTSVTGERGGTPRGAPAGPSGGAPRTPPGGRAWGGTRHHGRPRGLFCGIGICFDCLITVDGVPNQRACLVPVRPGMRLETGAASAAEDGGSDDA